MLGPLSSQAREALSRIVSKSDTPNPEDITPRRAVLKPFHLRLYLIELQVLPSRTRKDTRDLSQT
jgi:hypothetical protein